ncbi:unnamed protein product [Arabidopsis lyrata]|uniref:uncharacterized protein At5g41620 n=1 Tax=Arabidopsis lyrata subsp. lyrata TaxID=81972 RepID=UPI000A29CAA6|nr:uncharacterized protein At5g41620 [Arabidopsis lyrata subsp. lyrata]CAH8266140.1 unnamed protein product [Arabidopsis lyrata]|eukprot:XP_020885825.1 uncharacterized protein At5g41620 [Arabidopsis lyrata subsp. lyrata]
MERQCEEEEMETKLRRSFMGYSRRAGPSTPPPTWRLEFSPPRVGASSAVVETKEFLANSEVSVRKLCADLWETEQFRQRIELRHCRRRDSDVEPPSRSPLHDHQPPSRGSFRRQIAATDDHRNGDLLRPISPASCSSSSLEVVVRKPAFSQTGSSAVKSASYGLGSSSKLLKVLNRIWSLEEQNTANMSLVRALKMELDECRAEIKEVQQREKQSDRRLRKNKEEEEVKDVFRSIKRELDDERKVRKQSETLHRKLTRELCEAKHCLSKALKDLEKERQERVVVENLCDEFAKAVKDYEDKARRIGNKSPVSDKVIVQIAEVWNDQRLQMKLEEDDKTFLRAKEKSTSQSSKGSGLRAKRDDSVSMHQRVCLKELEEGLEKRTRRDNKLQLKKKSSCQVFNLSMSSEGDKIHPESSPRNVDDHESQEKSRTFSKILPRNVNVMIREDNHRTLKDKLMEARVESRRLRSSLKPE